LERQDISDHEAGQTKKTQKAFGDNLSNSLTVAKFHRDIQDVREAAQAAQG
jgi:hypothetical protein